MPELFRLDMKIVSVWNQSKATAIGDKIAVADSSITRFLGLMGQRSLEVGSGLWITPSSGVHTCWMRIPIDVVALDRSLRVLEVSPGVRPWRISGLSLKTHSVLELPVGQIIACRIEVDDRLEIVPSFQPAVGGAQYA
jgi:uncharacterized membrane protein (UPF0127 family)